MRNNSHHDVVINHYDSRADAYLNSTVHAQGADIEAMAQLVGHRPDAIALDMGCGGGHVSFRLASLVKKVVACDVSPTMLSVVSAEAQRRQIDNIVTKQVAAELLTCPDQSFDVVATRYSAHHWHLYKEGLGQIHRVLKNDGLAIFMDVVSPGIALLDTWLQSIELLRDTSHVRNASTAEWESVLKALGFEITQRSTYRLRLEFDAWIKRMNTPEIHAAAIRSLQQRAPSEVREYFELEQDGSFTVDSVLIAAQKR